MKQNEEQTIPSILINLASLLGTEVLNNRLEIPAPFGNGYCAGYVFNENIRMIISHYELNEDILIPNPESTLCKHAIFFKFQHIFRENIPLQPVNQSGSMPSVLIATSRLNTDEIIAIHTHMATINIEVDADFLSSLFKLNKKPAVLESLLQNKLPLMFDQLICPSVQKVVDDIIFETVDKTFELFFLKIKAEELVCRLLMELVNREEKNCMH